VDWISNGHSGAVVGLSVRNFTIISIEPVFSSQLFSRFRADAIVRDVYTPLNHLVPRRHKLPLIYSSSVPYLPQPATTLSTNGYIWTAVVLLYFSTFAPPLGSTPRSNWLRLLHQFSLWYKFSSAPVPPPVQALVAPPAPKLKLARFQAMTSYPHRGVDTFIRSPDIQITDDQQKVTDTYGYLDLNP